MQLLAILGLGLALIVASEAQEKNCKPNIVYIMADDLGWNDVGFHNPRVKTPNIDMLHRNGIELTNYHAQPLCTPSRSALLTGKYPSNNGLSQSVIREESRNCLPLEHKLMPQYMKELGYATKYVGKWHLGYCNASCLPTNRGFDEYRGIVEGEAGYFTWEEGGVAKRFVHDQPSVESVGTHTTVMETRDVKEFISAHKNNPKPLFLVLSSCAPHSPLDVTPEMFNVHDFLPADNPRRKFLGLVSALDNLVGETVQSLKDAGLYDNTIIVFTSDNGGASLEPPMKGFQSVANNYPLRNGKFSFYEGGTRVPAIFHDPRLKASTKGTKRDFLMHISDWLPTFTGLGGNGFYPDGLDGINQQINLGNSYYSHLKYRVRSNLLVALTDYRTLISECSTADAAFRWRDWKLIYGTRVSQILENANTTEWGRPAELPNLPEIKGDMCMRMENGKMVARCLFNLREDPSETNNRYDDPRTQGIVRYLIHKINEAKAESVKNTFSLPLPITSLNTRSIGERLVPRVGYCVGERDFPLVPNNRICLATPRTRGF